MDGSEELCKRVREAYGIPARCIPFEELSYVSEFDAIWACASLLHVNKANMPNVMEKVSAALKPGGILYASFKYGAGELTRDGRFFNNYQETDLDALLPPNLTLLEYQITQDVRPNRPDELWLNFIAKKT